MDSAAEDDSKTEQHHQIEKNWLLLGAWAPRQTAAAQVRDERANPEARSLLLQGW